MTSFDGYLDRTYDAASYTCLSFARDVLKDLTGHDIEAELADLFAAKAEASARLCDRHHRAFEALRTPEEPCLVFLAESSGAPHCGVYARGKVLHLLEGRGVRFQPLSDLLRLYPVVRFYRCA